MSDSIKPAAVCSADLVLLACNWSTMGDPFFVCHHLAALYAYGYVLVRTSPVVCVTCL